MKTTTVEETKVLFRKLKDGKIIALMPYITNYSGFIESYMHVGQHSSADYYGMIALTRPATEEEYADLKQELEYIGYNVKPIKKHIR